MAKFRQIPVVVEAVQWNKPDKNGHVKLARDCTDHPAVTHTGYMQIAFLCDTSGCSKEWPHWDWAVMGLIDTLEGRRVVSPGDWIIEGINGEFYPCKPDVFEKTYEPIDELQL